MDLALKSLEALHAESRPEVSSEVRFRRIFDAHYTFIWRTLRRLGVTADVVDDATQEAFMIAARRIADIQLGREKAFLFGVARRLAARARARSAMHAEVLSDSCPDLGARTPEDLLIQRDAHELLDEVLSQMSDDTREALVLFEIEGLSKREVADLLALPEGTAASRLRRAREEFLTIAHREKARRVGEWGTR